MSAVVKTCINLDKDAVRDAEKELGTSGTTQTVHAALREVVRQRRLRRLAAESINPKGIDEDVLAEVRDRGWH